MTRLDHGTASRPRLLAATAVLGGAVACAGAARASDATSQADANVAAGGVAMRRKRDGDPPRHCAVGNRPALNVNQAVQARWVQDIPGNMAQSNDAWPGLQGKMPRQTNS